MLSKPVNAKGILVKVIFGKGSIGAGSQPIEDEVNNWLQGQDDDIVVQDILYQHCLNASGENIVSVAIIYSKGEIPFYPF